MEGDAFDPVGRSSRSRTTGDTGNSLVDLTGYSIVLHELVHDASGPERAAEVAEPAEHERAPGVAAAEALLKSAEERTSGG
jgi:hypothetical protein